MERALIQTTRIWRLRLLLVFIAITCSALWVNWRFLSWVDLHVHDWLTRTLPQTATVQHVTLIDIDERSISAIGPWPWPRPVMAEIIENLRKRGARLQVWDMFIADTTLANQSLATAINDATDIVMGQVLIIDPKIQNPPQTGQLRTVPHSPQTCADQKPTGGYLGVAPELRPMWVGHLSATPDADGKLRRLPAILCDDREQRFPQLAVTAVQALSPQAQWEQKNGHPLWGPAQWLERAGIKIPLDEAGNIIIPYARDHTDWSAISAYQLLSSDAALPSLRNHIVIVGASALGVGDIVSTPRHPNTPGVSIHSELISSALNGNWLIEPQALPLFSAVLTLVSALLLLPLTQPQTRLVTVVSYVSLFMVVPLVVASLGRLQGLMLPVAVPTLTTILFGGGILLLRADAERQRAQQLAQHLESFLPASLAHEIAWQAPSNDSLGKLCQGVLLSVRVTGLERWTSSVDSLQALGLAHAISTVAEHIAKEQGGALELVHGEILLITWPHITEDSANAALRTARQLTEKLQPLLQQNESVRYPIGLQIALETGSFLMGLAGPHTSRRLLLLGPVVDTVQAMLPFCEELASPILVGKQLAQLQTAEKLIVLGQFLLPDQVQPRTLYRVAQ